MAACVAGALSAQVATGEAGGAGGKPGSSFYTDAPLFSTRPDEAKSEFTLERFGPVGLGISLHQPAFVMKIKNVEKGSPAEATGKLKSGQIIETVNGQKLKEIDPRIQLGNIITQAEATDGKVTLMVKDTPEAVAQEVVVQIPVLGAYSKTWPLNCPKSDKIVRGMADWLAAKGDHYGAMVIDQGLLFLLSTGEEKDLNVARGWIKEIVAKYKDADISTMYPWSIGYGAPALCEYYLRTGDETVLPIIDKVSAHATRTMYNSGWNQKTSANIEYGHMNAAGVHCLKFLLLARECGAKVDEYTLQEALKHMYRFAGHNNVPYGDHLPENGFIDNGKVGGLAFAMAAAASLTPEGEKSVYAKARDISAIKSFYSTSWMLHGHTGGGIGEIWRSSAMGLVHDQQPVKYREFMDNRIWHYELSRRYDGSFAILGGGDGYATPDWGVGFAMTYTVPRKTLRMTGAPLTKFCKSYKLPERPWGTQADEAFISLTPAPNRNGKTQDVGTEKLATDSAVPILRRMKVPPSAVFAGCIKRNATWTNPVNEAEVSDEVLLMYARHIDQGVREFAAQVIAKKAADPLILELLKDKDPRARHAGLLAINSPARLNDEVTALLLGMINDPEESLWVVRSALAALSMASKEVLSPQVDRLCFWLQHDEWWLQTAALTALSNLVADEQQARKILPLVGKIMSTTQILPLQQALAGVMAKLQQATPEMQAYGVKILSQAYTAYPAVTKAPGGMDITGAQGVLLNITSGALTGFPNGYDALYALAKERLPNQALPHKEIFLNADPEKLGPKVKEAMTPIIRDNLIYEYIGKNRYSLLAEAAASGPCRNFLERRCDVRGGSHKGLVELYNKIGVHDYDWHTFGPNLKDATWDYHTFDPPEKMAFDVSSWRYRPVTYPQGMENWFASDFDAGKAGWKKGQGPFGQLDGKLLTDLTPRRNPHLRDTGPMRTLWEREVLLLRGTFQFPPRKPGHLYRLRLEDGHNPGSGGGFKLYLNGKPMAEMKTGNGQFGGGMKHGVMIAGEVAAEFEKGPVTIAVTAFLRYGERAVLTMPPVPLGVMAIWVEEMKLPPFDDEAMRKSATVIPMTCAAWQALQNLQDAERDPEAGKFKWDGASAPNKAVMGVWTTVAVVPTVEAFDPAKPVDANRAPFKGIAFKDGGATESKTLIWSGDILMDLSRYEALKMVPKKIGETDYLFIEIGGFDAKAGKDWKSPLCVLKRQEAKK
jgi:hypothetical protein